MVIAGRANPNGKFTMVTVTPTSGKGRKVIFCIPVGRKGGGWRAVGEAVAKMVGASVKERIFRPVARVANNVSFVDVLQGAAALEVGMAPKKKRITFSCSFTGDAKGWEKVAAYLVVAREWHDSCGSTMEKSSLRREDEDSDLKVVLGAPNTEGLSERIETDIAVAVASGQVLSEKMDTLLGAIQNLNVGQENVAKDGLRINRNAGHVDHGSVSVEMGRMGLMV